MTRYVGRTSWEDFIWRMMRMKHGDTILSCLPIVLNPFYPLPHPIAPPHPIALSHPLPSPSLPPFPSPPAYPASTWASRTLPQRAYFAWASALSTRPSTSASTRIFLASESAYCLIGEVRFHTTGMVCLMISTGCYRVLACFRLCVSGGLACFRRDLFGWSL